MLPAAEDPPADPEDPDDPDDAFRDAVGDALGDDGVLGDLLAGLVVAADADAVCWPAPAGAPEPAVVAAQAVDAAAVNIRTAVTAIARVVTGGLMRRSPFVAV